MTTKLNANSIEFGSVTTAQRNAISATIGEMVYNTDSGAFEAYGPSGWKTIKGIGATPVTWKVWGAGGGNGAGGPCSGGGRSGGQGHTVAANGAFDLGSTFVIYVGGNGSNACNGGGGPNGGRPGGGGRGGGKCGGGGGGATSVYLNGPYATGTLILVGGGGGGGGQGPGEPGGYPSPGNPQGGDQTRGGVNPGSPGYGGAWSGASGGSFQGGGSQGGGGGSGYFGGAGGRGDNGDCHAALGYGGSGYSNPTYFPSPTHTNGKDPAGQPGNFGGAAQQGYVTVTSPGGSSTFTYTNTAQTYSV